MRKHESVEIAALIDDELATNPPPAAVTPLTLVPLPAPPLTAPRRPTPTAITARSSAAAVAVGPAEDRRRLMLLSFLGALVLASLYLIVR